MTEIDKSRNNSISILFRIMDSRTIIIKIIEKVYLWEQDWGDKGRWDRKEDIKSLLDLHYSTL